MSDAVTLTGNSRPWGGQVTGDHGPYTERQWHAIYRSLFDGSGNRGPLMDAAGTQLQVTQRGAGANMSVDIAAGASVIDGVWAESGSVVNLTVAASDPVQDRYDLVFGYWDAASQTTKLRIVDGSLGGGSCESIANYQTTDVEWGIPLACVYVAAAVSSILNAAITDLREFCRFRFSPEDLVDGATLTTIGALITIAAGGVGVAEIAAAIAGAGLTGGGGSALAVNPDGTTLEISGDTVRIAATAAGNGLTGGGASALAANPDNTTVEISSDQLKVKTIDNSYVTNRTRTDFLGASELHESSANPPTWGAIGSQPVPAEGWVCDTATDDYVIGAWQAPSWLVTGAVTIIFVWSHVAASNQTARLYFNYVTDLDCGGDLTGGTTTIGQDGAANSADANERVCTTLSTTVSMSAGQILNFVAGRNGTHGNDGYSGSAVLLGIGFSYTADM